ncbi:MAG: M56 family metallopeptidase [Muribaculaceae bacterium]|nr:M56 family metallopeptidase [Muribaculaceae bacterium]
MGSFLSYSIISGLMMLAMYLAYRLFLARDNQHGFNRGVLLAIYLLSFITIPIISAIEKLTASATAPTLSFDSIEIASGNVVPMAKPVWGTILIWIFIAGMAIVFIKTAITWLRLTAVIRSGQKVRRSSYILVVTDNERYAPFSWMHYVVVSRRDYENNCSAIIAHELKHVSSCHWVDLIVAQTVCIVNWFNPVAWLMRDELMLVHEYQADMAVIDAGHDAQEYQMLLIEKAVGSRFPSLANSLNHSKLKKRITMMYKEKSGAGRRFKALALVPMLALAVGAASVPAVRAAVSTISNSALSVGEDSKKTSDDKISVQRFQVTNINKDGHETAVTIKGIDLGEKLTVSGGTFTSDGKTFRAKALDCNMTDGEATIIARFQLSGEYKNPAMTLTINGDEIPFNLENFFNDSQIVVIGTGAVKKSAGTTGNISSVVIRGGSSSEPGETSIYMDGKEISRDDLDKILPDNISSVAVDKQNNAIIITSKKTSTVGNLKIYLDGKQITSEEMNAIPSDAISSMSIDTENNTIQITTKQ